LSEKARFFAKFQEHQNFDAHRKTDAKKAKLQTR